MYFQMRQDFPKNPLNGTGDLSHSLKLPLRKCSCVKQGCLPWDRDVYPILDWAFPFDCSTDLQIFCGQCTFWAACLSECLLIYFLCRRVVLSNSRFYCIALSSLGSVWGDLDHPLWWLQWFCISRVSFPWNKPVCFLVNVVGSVLLAVGCVGMPLWSGPWTNSSDILFSWNAPGLGVCLHWTVVYFRLSKMQLFKYQSMAMKSAFWFF